MVDVKIILFLILMLQTDAGGFKLDENLKHKQLRKDKLVGYDRVVGPVDYRDKKHLLIRFTLMITNLIGLDTKKQTISLDGWEIKSWIDSHLKWQPKDYGGLRKTLFTPDEIWVPDVTLYNRADSHTNLPKKHFTNVNVKSYGRCIWLTPNTFTGNCKMQVKYWPVDEQVCTLTFGSWTYFDHEMTIKPHVWTNVSDVRVLPSNGEWIIKSIDISTGKEDHSRCCGGNYSSISYTITIVRKPAYLLFYLTPPAALLGILTLLSFFIPTESGERIGFVTTIFLTMMVLLLLLPEYLPETSDELPILGMVIITFLILTAVVLVLTIVILKCYHSKGNPSPIMRFLLCQSKRKALRQEAVSPTSPTESPTSKVNEGRDDVNDMKIIEDPGCMPVKVPKPAVFTEDHVKDEEDFSWHEVSEKMNWVFFWIMAILFSTIVLTFLSS